MTQTLHQRAGLRLAHDRADPLGNLLEAIEDEEYAAEQYARHEPIPTRLYVLAFAMMLTVLICAVLP